ncbi:hypothetical protein DA075_29830 [Methylobacterium currus]|uniref:Uncharacterized protein n=1 Tax=Methylobacterium currus TaxID=2051553 RepID=A0A2R4WSN9_9HYPH|nr:hypothetical protein [Methylobacterium currus]AWB24533.1 hypothetical protein DA075_29830 [Methylobacterium currus]
MFKAVERAHRIGLGPVFCEMRIGGQVQGQRIAFVNRRAEAWWRFREALDPDQNGGSPIALPPNPELRADLCAPTWTLTARGIQIESKDDLRKRLGRSPGKGGAVVMSWSEGERTAEALRKREKVKAKAPALAPRFAGPTSWMG